MLFQPLVVCESPFFAFDPVLNMICINLVSGFLVILLVSVLSINPKLVTNNE